jgi:hypothetical protein
MKRYVSIVVFLSLISVTAAAAMAQTTTKQVEDHSTALARLLAVEVAKLKLEVTELKLELQQTKVAGKGFAAVANR